MINVLDANGHSTVEFPDFLDYMGRCRFCAPSDEELVDACKSFDQSGSGFISESDFRAVIRNTMLGSCEIVSSEQNSIFAFSAKKLHLLGYANFLVVILSDRTC